MAQERFETYRVVHRLEPLGVSERRVSVDEMSDVFNIVQQFVVDNAKMRSLRRLLAENLCLAVHNYSDDGLLKEVSARVFRGELEIRATDIHIPENFPIHASG